MAVEYLFARHGESIVNLSMTISNRVDGYSPLTPPGRQQAEALAGSLQNRQVIAIYSSPLMRARETAEIVAARLGLEIVIADALREPYCGVIEGRSEAQAWAIHAAAAEAWRMRDYAYRLPGGESLEDVRARFIPFLRRMVEKHERDTGSILMNMLPLVVENIDRDFVEANPLTNCALVRVKAAGSGMICVEWCGIAMG